MVRQVPLSGQKAAGRCALVDDEDYSLVSRFKWFVMDHPHHTVYARTVLVLDGTKRTVYMHFLITGWERTAHLNHDGLDNRRENLRRAGYRSIRYSARKKFSGKYRYKGVYRHPNPSLTRPWQAKITVDGRPRSLGYYATDEEAARAYDHAVRRFFGQSAWVNFP